MIQLFSLKTGGNPGIHCVNSYQKRKNQQGAALWCVYYHRVMEKFFNTAGPNQPDIHYTLSPLRRVNWPELSSLIAARKYFILHAPRQTGKTSLLINLMHFLNEQGQYRALYVNIEAAQAARNDVAEAMRSIVQVMASCAGLYWRDKQARQSALTILNLGSML